MKRNSVLLILLLILCHASVTCAQTVHLSIAASMTEVFKELISTFTKDHPQAQMLPNFASSGSLAKQIDQGAPADFYVSANPKWMNYLIAQELIAPETDRIFAHNQLVFISAGQAVYNTIETLSTVQRIAIGSPKSVPAGQYAKQAMENAGIYEQLVKKKKLVLAKDVRQALLYADRGEVDGAFVYATDVLLAKQAKVLFVVPPALYDRVSYPLGLTTSGQQNSTAKKFYTFMGTPEALAILSTYGFIPVPIAKEHKQEP